MPRTGSSENATRVLSEVLGPLDAVAGVIARPRGRGRADIEVRFAGGQTLVGEVKALAHPTTLELAGLARRWRRRVGDLRILVADVVPEQARPALVRAGISFLDRRGHLLLVGPGVLIQAVVPPAQRPGRGGGHEAVRGESGIAVALATLLRPDDPPGVRAIQRISGLSVGAVSKARQQLRGARLLDRSYRPLVPELFWALAARWTPGLSDLPTWPGGGKAANRALDQRFHARLRVPLLEGLEEALAAYPPGRPLQEPDPHAGWTLTGTLAAAAYGADVVAGAGSVPELLVPPEDWYRVASHTVAPAPGRRPVARLAAAPTLLAVRLRRPARKSAPFPLAHPLVVALELARDPSRGREILATFSPEGCRVVWR